MADTLVFIPAWNEEANLPAVLDDLRAELPDVDVLVVDDGSTDRTADVAREHGAEVLSLGVEPRAPGRDRGRLPLRARARLRVLRPRRRRRPAPARGARARSLALVRRDALRRRGRLALRLGRGVCGAVPLRADRSRRFGTAVLRRAMGLVLGARSATRPAASTP